MIIFLGVCSIISFVVFLALSTLSGTAMEEIFAVLFLLNSSVLLIGAAVVEAVRNVRKELAGE